jgi:hypothetical protein
VLRILPGASRALAPALTQTRLTRIWTLLLAVIRLSVCRLPVPAGCGRRLALPRWVSPAGGERLIEPLRAQRRRTWATSSSSLRRRVSRTRERPAAAGPAYAARLTGETTRATARSIGRTGRRPVATSCRLGRRPARGRGIGLACGQGEGAVDRLVIRSRRAERLVMQGCLVGGCRPGLSGLQAGGSGRRIARSRCRSAVRTRSRWGYFRRPGQGRGAD